MLSGKMPVPQFYLFAGGYSKRFLRPYYFKPNMTKRLLADVYRTAIRNASVKFSKHVDLTTLPYVKDPYNEKPLSRNYIGKYEVDCTAYNEERNDIRLRGNGFLSSASQILVALKCYKIKHGNLPDSLNELVPEYFKEIPNDPFDDKPLRYSKKKGIIYSVGRDTKDSGGATAADLKTYKDNPQMLLWRDDPSVLIGF